VAGGRGRDRPGLPGGRGLSAPLVLVDADVLGRQRTGDETYVEQLLGALPAAAPDLRFAAVTRRPELVPAGVEAILLPARSQELRMAWRLPRLLRRVRPAVGHFVHSLPLPPVVPAVVTVQDLSFERDPSVMSRTDRWTFKLVVPRAARRAAKVLAISERTRDDLVDLYGIAPEKIVVTPLAHDPAFRPGANGHEPYLLFVGAIEPRKDPVAAAEAAAAVGRRLVVVGPTKDESLAAELRRRGADLRGYVPKDELVRLYQRASALVFPSRYEGFGLPLLEAMASGTPVVATPDAALREVAGDAAVLTEDLAAGVREALADRERLVAASLARARAFSWAETARRTAEVYREVIGR
jgi:glycosyltransferase involved in cell wall biosynthesis